MRKIGQVEFPETPDEMELFDPRVEHVALHSNVLAVMRTRIEGTWVAYCAPVPGMNHDAERYSVLKLGEKLPENIARAMFGFMEGVPYAR